MSVAWNKGLTKETDERVKKNSEAKMGYHHTKETKEKLRQVNIGNVPINAWGNGHIPWNKGLKGKQVAWNKGLDKDTDERVKQYGEKQQGKSLSEETKNKISISKKGKSINSQKFLTKEHKGNLSKAHIGIPLSKNHRMNIMKALRGENCYNWKGGINPFRKSLRNCFEYRQWRSDIFTRDDFTCQECGQRGGKLNAHHIKSFSSILQKYEITTFEEALECDELWNINNGITLCKECHKKLRGDNNGSD